jgi:hypothetical protein
LAADLAVVVLVIDRAEPAVEQPRPGVGPLARAAPADVVPNPDVERMPGHVSRFGRVGDPAGGYRRERAA